MAAVKSRDTRPELALRKAMFAAGLRGWRCHRSDLPGKPDIVFSRARVAVFVDGAFWHGHPSKYWKGRSGPYWDAKIDRNRRRDARVNAELCEMGWTVVRLWDFEVQKNAEEAVQRIEGALGGCASARSA